MIIGSVIKYGKIYDFLNFIFTARHLEDWIKNDIEYNDVIRLKCEQILNYDNNPEWSTIVTLCNKGKHFILSEKNKAYEKVKVKYTGLFDFGNLDFSNFSFETSRYVVEVGEMMISLNELCEKIMKDYEKIFGY